MKFHTNRRKDVFRETRNLLESSKAHFSNMLSKQIGSSLPEQILQSGSIVGVHGIRYPTQEKI